MTTRRTPILPLLSILAALTVAACGSGAATSAPAQSASVPPSPSASASASASVEASASPSESASPSPDASPSEDAGASPSDEASASPGDASARPSAGAQLNDEESRLVEQLRPDALSNCEPRRDDLPDGATAGVECAPEDDLVERVGVYGFEDDAAAETYYTDRLEAAGVEPDSGACGAGDPGDAPVAEGVAERGRVGCFLDEFGQANTRVLCGDGRYIGVLGTDDDIQALHEWTVAYEEGQSETGGPVGICLGPAGGIDTG